MRRIGLPKSNTSPVTAKPKTLRLAVAGTSAAVTRRDFARPSPFNSEQRAQISEHDLIETRICDN